MFWQPWQSTARPYSLPDDFRHAAVEAGAHANQGNLVDRLYVPLVNNLAQYGGDGGRGDVAELGENSVYALRHHGAGANKGVGVDLGDLMQNNVHKIVGHTAQHLARRIVVGGCNVD